jgi:hypothetical protein
VTAADIARWSAAYVATALPVARSQFEETARLIPHPRAKPAFTHLLVDTSGRLWAREFGYDGDRQVWAVFNASGAYLGQLSLPPDVRVVEIGHAHILAIATDDDLVQSLRVYVANMTPR